MSCSNLFPVTCLRQQPVQLAPLQAGTTIAAFTYDGDGKRVRSVMGGETTYFIGGHYEVKGSQITKYYFAGAQRVAMRKYTIPQSMTVEYLYGDHLGSTSITADSTGAKVSEMRYNPWGETRYAWTSGASTTPAYKLSNYTFTGQYSYMDDLTTSGATEGFGLMFYNARWYDPYLNHFTQPDTIVPDPYNPQDWDRYAYSLNNPIRYNDPTGHSTCSTVSNQYAKGKCEDWSPENEDYDPCAFNAWDCSGPIDWSNGTQLISRPIIGIHLGGSGNLGIAVENYGYFQGDLLFDPSSGAFYGMTTTGNGGYIGTPNGIGGELYGGISSVHGIPGNLNSEEVADLLEGPNMDVAVEVGADAGVEVSGSMGVSLDINPVTGGFQETTAGQMYTVERSVSGGASPIPTALDVGVEAGRSYSHAYFLGRIRWWPALLP